MVLFLANPQLLLQVVVTGFLSIVTVRQRFLTHLLKYPWSVLNSFIKRLEF